MISLCRAGGVLDTGGLDEEVQEPFRYKDDGTVEVHRWINDVHLNAFRGMAIVCSGALPRHPKVKHTLFTLVF